MNNFPPYAASDRQLRWIGVLTEYSDEEGKDLFNHARQLWSLVSGMEEGTREVAKKSEAVEDGDNDDVGIEDNKANLEHVNVVVVAQFAEHVIPVVEELPPDSEAIADPEPCTDLGDHGKHFIRR